MRKFFNIGKAVLFRAIGLQENYIILLQSTKCDSCPYQKFMHVFDPDTPEYKEAYQKCQECSFRTKKYINETNKYGYQPMIKTNAIKLFLLLNQLADNDGFITEYAVNLAATLKCDKKTVLNNLDILKNNGYINYKKIKDEYKQAFIIYLNDFSSYYLKANKGGRGYLTISEACFKELINIKDINTLRISIRSLLEMDEINQKGYTGYSKTYTELRRCLPKYCKPNVITKSLNKMSMFSIQIDEKIHIHVKDEFNSKKQKEEISTYYRHELYKFYKAFNNEVDDVNNFGKPIESCLYKKFFENDPAHCRQMIFSYSDTVEISKMCIYHSFNEIMDAIKEIYITYYQKGIAERIESVPAVLRTIIKNKNKDLEVKN